VADEDEHLLALCRLRLAQLTEARAELAEADEALLAQLERRESSADFTESEWAALSFAEQCHYDAQSTLNRTTVRQSLVDDLTSEAIRLHDAFFGQIVELVFKFMWWSTNRASVTLGDDGPHDANRLTSFRYDKTGAYVVEAG